MKFNLLNKALLGLILSACLSVNVANAGLISDTDNDSFIDDTTGLEWMDFGINNGQSFNYVSSQLTAGGVYYGWRLATEEEVYTLTVNAFLGLGAELESIGDDEIYAADYQHKNVWGDVFSVMGYNSTWTPDGEVMANISRGLFADSHNTLQVASFNDILNPVDAYFDDIIYSNNAQKSYLEKYRLTAGDAIVSTFLVKKTSIPEPSTLAIFALGIIGLASRKLKSNL